MYWMTAIELARNFMDLSYEEWCNLYIDYKNPNEFQLRLCEETAHKVLVRHNVIEPNVTFINRPKLGVPISA